MAMEVLGGELNQTYGIHRIAMAGEDDRAKVSVGSWERPDNDCSFAFVGTTELHDYLRVRKNCVSNGGNSRFFESIHDAGFLVVIRDETFRECRGVHEDCWIKMDHGRGKILEILFSDRIRKIVIMIQPMTTLNFERHTYR